MIARISLCRLGQPEDIASAFVFLASAVRFSKGGTYMKKMLPLLLLLFLLTGCSASGNQESSYRQITMDEAVTIIEEESDYIILVPLIFPMKPLEQRIFPNCLIKIS